MKKLFLTLLTVTLIASVNATAQNRDAQNAESVEHTSSITNVTKTMQVTKAGKYRGHSTDPNAHTLTIRCNWMKWVTCYTEKTVNGTTQIEINNGPILGPKPGGIVVLSSTPGTEADPGDGSLVDTHTYYNGLGWNIWNSSTEQWETLAGSINYWVP